MRILFVHQNFPGQYKHLATALARDSRNEIVALGVEDRQAPAGVRLVRYNASRPESRAHALASTYEGHVLAGEATARAALDLKKAGFNPDLICGHPGWGETLFLRDVWPDTRILSFMEFYHRGQSADFNFDPEFPVVNPAAFWKLRARNAGFLLAIEASDWCVSPTQWQWRQLPQFARNMTSIIHDGIDTDAVKPDPNAVIRLGRAGTCRVGDEVVSFVNRNLEPYRGYHIFVRALPEILARRPSARAVIVGGDEVSYGPAAPKGSTWKNVYLREVADRLDFSRVHFVGKVPYSTYINLLQVSAAHVYLTYPFVLSWSMLEAMAAGCLVIGSRTPPVEEFIQQGKNGLLVDFHSPQELAENVVHALERPLDFRDLRLAARQTILNGYDLKTHCLPKHLNLINSLAQTGRPPADLVPTPRMP